MKTKTLTDEQLAQAIEDGNYASRARAEQLVRAAARQTALDSQAHDELCFCVECL